MVENVIPSPPPSSSDPSDDPIPTFMSPPANSTSSGPMNKLIRSDESAVLQPLLMLAGGSMTSSVR